MLEELIKKHGAKKVDKILDYYGFRREKNVVYDAGNFVVKEKTLSMLCKLIENKLGESQNDKK